MAIAILWPFFLQAIPVLRRDVLQMSCAAVHSHYTKGPDVKRIHLIFMGAVYGGPLPLY